MSADLLRRAAALIRDDYPSFEGHPFVVRGYEEERQFHLAVADALALYADLIDEHPSAIPMDHKMLAVAHAYLGEGADA